MKSPIYSSDLKLLNQIKRLNFFLELDVYQNIQCYQNDFVTKKSYSIGIANLFNVDFLPH